MNDKTTIEQELTININEIQKEINRLFGKYKIPALTRNLPMQNLHKWSKAVSKHFNLDSGNFSQTVTELFWSLASVQLSLGYALIASESCEYREGAQGRALHEKDLPNAITMPGIHFWYHIYNSYECIYRCWERVASVLKNACYPSSSDKKYFDGIINDLNKDERFNQNAFLRDLKKQVKNWNNIAKARNDISHDKSSPLRNMQIQGKVSDVLGASGLPLIYLDYSVASPRKELENVVDKYRKVLPVIKAMKEFIDRTDN